MINSAKITAAGKTLLLLPSEPGLLRSPCLPSPGPASSHRACLSRDAAASGCWPRGTGEVPGYILLLRQGFGSWPRAGRQPCGDVPPAGATRCSLPCGFPARCRHKGMACVGVWWRGESAGRSAAGNRSQRVPESPSQGRGVVGDVSSHLVLGHRGAEERGPPCIPSLEEVGLCKAGQGESPGMLVLHGPQSSADFFCSPSQQQGSLHHRVLLSKAVTVLEEGTFIPLSSQCLHEHTPVASGHRPCTAPLPQLPSKAPCKKQAAGPGEKRSQQTEKLVFWRVIVLLLWEGRDREVGQDRGWPSFSKRCHSGAAILGEPWPFGCQQAGAN